MRLFVRTAKPYGRGVTLLELMISLAIIGVLSSITMHQVFKFEEKSNVVIAMSDLNNIASQIMLFYIKSGRYPDTLAEIGWEMIDPWGNPYYYLNVTAGEKGPPKGARKDKSLHPVNTDFDLYSAGKDGKTNAPLTAKSSRDDVIRGGNGGYYGLAESF